MTKYTIHDGKKRNRFLIFQPTSYFAQTKQKSYVDNGKSKKGKIVIQNHSDQFFLYNEKRKMNKNLMMKPWGLLLNNNGDNFKIEIFKSKVKVIHRINDVDDVW